MVVAAMATGILVGSVESLSAQNRSGGNQRTAEPAGIAYRKTMMLSNRQHMSALRTIIDGGLDLPLHVLLHTEALRNNGRMFADIFNEEPTSETSRARAEIWTRQEDFAARLKAFVDASRRLNAIAQRGFNDQTLTALNELQETCRACHMTFRKPAPPAS